MAFKVSIAKSNSELELALDLVCQVFFSHTNMTQEIFRRRKELDWHNFDFFEKDSVIVSKDSNKIVGVIRIVYRVFHIEGEIYKAAGFTDVCVNDKYRGKGISRLMMEYANNVVNAKCDIGLLFASKKVDYYYNKYGFWGVSTYNKLIVKNQIFKSNACLQSAINQNLDYFDYLYNQKYSNLNGFMERTSKYWVYILEKCLQLKIKFKAIVVNNKVCGYCIYKDNVIYEIAYNSSVDIKDILAQFKIYHEVLMEIDEQHDVVSQLKFLDVTLCSRSCIFGGHMIKILNAQVGLDVEDTLDFIKVKNRSINFSKFNQF
jgi:predicted acetyltransferase